MLVDSMQEIPTSRPLGMVLGSTQENPDVIPIKSALSHSSLGPPESTSQTASRLVQLFSQGSWSLQTDRPTEKPCYSICSKRPHLDSAAMRPKKVSRCTKKSKNVTKTCVHPDHPCYRRSTWFCMCGHTCDIHSKCHQNPTRMWANAQRDGRPAKYR